MSKKGWDAAEAAKRIRPDRIEGWYWATANIGLYAEAPGTFVTVKEGLSSHYELNAEQAVKLKPLYDDGGPYRSLGIYYTNCYGRCRIWTKPISIEALLKGKPQKSTESLSLCKHPRATRRHQGRTKDTQVDPCTCPRGRNAPEIRRYQALAQQKLKSHPVKGPNHMNSSLSNATFPKIHAQIERLYANKTLWKTMSCTDKLSILNQMFEQTQKVDHQAWGSASIHRQGYDPSSPLGEQLGASEQMINAAAIVGTLRALIRTYTSLSQNNQPPELPKPEARPDSRSVVKVFPHDLADKFGPLGLAGITGELWIEPNQNGAQEYAPKGNVSLVLGAGNQSFLAFGDVMHEMFIKGNLCILKHHPVRSFSAPFYEQILHTLSSGIFVSLERSGSASGFVITSH